MKVQDVMTTDVISIPETMRFKDIVETMLAKKVSGLPVVDGHGTLVGVVTEQDLLGKEAYAGAKQQGIANAVKDFFAGREFWTSRAEGRIARDIMTADPVTAEPEELVRAAARRMIEEDVKRLPVVQDGRLVGVVSRSDLLRVYTRSDDDLRSSVDALLHRSMFVPPDHEIAIAVRDGVVSLTGHVRSPSDSRVVETLVASSDGVVGVHNLLHIRDQEPRTGM